MNDRRLTAETLAVLSNNVNKSSFIDRPFDKIKKVYEIEFNNYSQISFNKALDIVLKKEKQLVMQWSIDPETIIKFETSSLKNLTKTLFNFALALLPYIFDENYELKTEIKSKIPENKCHEFIKRNICLSTKIHKALWAEYIQKFYINYCNTKKLNESQKNFLNTLTSRAADQIMKSWEKIIETHYNLKPEIKAARIFSESLQSCIRYLEADLENLQSNSKNEAVNAIKKPKYDALLEAKNEFNKIKDAIDDKLKKRQVFSTEEIETNIQTFHNTINVTLSKVLHHTNPFFERANRIIDSLIKHIKYLLSKKNSFPDYSNSSHETSAKTVFFETSTYANIKTLRREMQVVEPLIRSNLLKKS